MADGKTRLPDWLKSHLTEADLPRIAQAVAAAEKGTSGEIIPVIVHHSQAYRTAKRMFWLILLLILTPVFMSVEHVYSYALLAAFFVLWFFDQLKPSWLSGRGFLVKFLDPTDVAEGVERRAALKFETLRVQHTSKRTGVLIYISYFERRALIMGDKAISEKIRDEEWQELLGAMLAKIRGGQMAVGLEQAIASVGAKLKQHFPAEPTDSNELANELVILDEL